eukprot:841753_1
MDLSGANTYFEWKINNYWIQRWKNAEVKEMFESPRFDAIGARWYMQIYPNGWKTEGTADLFITCRSIKSDEKAIHFCHFIEIDALNHSQISFSGNYIVKKEDIKLTSPFKWNDLQNQSEITVCIKIWEQGSLPRNTARLISNIYSEKMTQLRKEFADQNSTYKQENERMRAELGKVAMKEVKEFEQDVEEIVIDKE